MYRHSFYAAVLAFAAGSGASAARAQLAADLIIHNANIHTLDDKAPTAAAVAVRDGKIAAVGSNEGVLQLRGPSTRVIDAGGKTLIPGFYDSHIHVSSVGHNLGKVQTNDLTSLDQFLERIKAWAARTAKGQWIQSASDWHESQLKENRFPTRWELDAVAPDHPVFIRRGGHNVVINSVALKLAGIAEDAKDPPGGHYDLDKQGRITGWILERPAIEPIAKLVPEPSPVENEQAIKRAMQALSAVGITGVRDLHVLPPDVRAWNALVQKDEATVRGYLMLSIHPRRPAAEDFAQWGSMGIASGFGSDRLRIGGLKITHDGGVEAAVLSSDYANKEGFRGIPVTPALKIRQVAEWACRNGWQLGVHALGDQATLNVLAIFDDVSKTCPVAGRRWGIEHPYLLSSAAIEQMKRLGIVAHMQTPHNYTLGAGWVQYWGKERANRIIQNRTFIDAGVMVAGGTDAPVTPYSPFLAMWTDVTRKTAAAGILGPQEAITALESLKLRTLWAARGSFLEDKVGSVEAGKYADLVLVSDDPLAIPPDGLRELTALMTIFEGKIVYQRP